MDLYKFYNGDELLYKEYDALERIPKYFWKKLLRKPEELIKREKYIALDPFYALQYAISIKKGPWPEGEDAIATSPEHALEYATHVLRGRFKKGEKAIATDAEVATYYADVIIDGRFPGAEPTILKDPYELLNYMNMLDDRWEEGEAVLKKTKYWDRYKYIAQLS